MASSAKLCYFFRILTSGSIRWHRNFAPSEVTLSILTHRYRVHSPDHLSNSRWSLSPHAVAFSGYLPSANTPCCLPVSSIAFFSYTSSVFCDNRRSGLASELQKSLISIVPRERGKFNTRRPSTTSVYRQGDLSTKFYVLLSLGLEASQSRKT